MKLKSSRKFDAALENPFICYLDLGGGGSAPAPDPAIGAAAQQNAEVAREALAFNKQVYADNQPRQAASDALATRVVNDQLAISQQNQTQAADQWNRFQTIFAPVENQTVADATNIDSAGELARASGEAAAGVQTQFDNAAGQRIRSQAAMGINPNSGRAMAMDSEAQLGLAASKAGASNNARLVARDRGIALRAGVANFGRNMPNTAANAYSTAISGGSNAMNNQNSTMATANANAGQMNTGFNTSINGTNSAMQGLNQQYSNQLSAFNSQVAQDNNNFNNSMRTVGTVAALFASSKKIKTNKQPIEDAKILSDVKTLPVEKWDYKGGEGDGGEHVGPYAEDVQAKFGDKAAPGGKAIDIISMNGITLSAVKGLSKQVDKLEKKVANIAARGIRRA